jgi:hypothetical protein
VSVEEARQRVITAGDHNRKQRVKELIEAVRMEGLATAMEYAIPKEARIAELEKELREKNLEFTRLVRERRTQAEARADKLEKALREAQRWCDYHWAGEVGAPKALNRVRDALREALGEPNE